MLKRKKNIIIAAAVAVVIAMIILLVNYNTNYTWRYRDLLNYITDVQNSKAITEVRFSYSTHSPVSTFKVMVSGENLSEKEIYQMGYDIAAKIDRRVFPGMNQPLLFNTSDLWLQVYATDQGIGISCERLLKVEKQANGTLEYYEWIFEKRPTGEMEKKIITDIYPPAE